MTVKPASTNRVRSSDVEIFYRRFGSDGRTPVIILHGLSFFSYDWREVAAVIASDREVVAVDMRGFGESDWSPSRNYGLETMTNDVITVLDALHWKRAVLMGHSFGGRVCVATAGRRAERTAGLVLVDFAPDLAPLGRRHVAERIGRQPDVFASIDDCMRYHNENPNDRVRRARWEAFLKKTDQGYVLKRDLHFRDNFRRTLEGKPSAVPEFLWPILGEIKVPILMVRGRDSDMFAAETMHKVRATNPAIRIVEIAGGHDLAKDNSQGVSQVINEFLAHAQL